MPKLLSRSKHEEFKSNLALQTRDEKERRAENEENLELQEIPAHTVHLPTTVHLPATVHCKTRENFNFRKKSKTAILVKIQNFSRSWMIKRTSSLESSREI